jgi:hypothetical protein
MIRPATRRCAILRVILLPDIVHTAPRSQMTFDMTVVWSYFGLVRKYCSSVGMKLTHKLDQRFFMGILIAYKVDQLKLR